ncbi:hypothetical protein O6H91_05G008700 [Diphasiastrum complanatum]|uniref:Uncharacterized protein n=1 Tax=Diphasiastrum complanatum TaxID=34168 RepID=A0ACC2DKF9_DIPCM|nr:hypothetical protein O6H91_Y334300 [Diphasiastrum complanatum]KAJ7554775.1 hypothetical protein O6H91_05G008700 [Diphasiastrum complanatum]
MQLISMASTDLHIFCSLDLPCIDKLQALRLKGAATAAILTACALGMMLSLLTKRSLLLRPNSRAFCIIKAFAAGVVLATGFVHVLPDAFQCLHSRCLPRKPWSSFPFAGFIAMLASLFTLLLEVLGTAYYESRQPREGVIATSNDVVSGKSDVVSLDVFDSSNICDDSPGLGGLHQHTFDREQQTASASLRYTVISQVLELGVVTHSLVIGIALGTSQNPCTIRPLIAALTFHQFFEAIALGGCISQAGLKHMTAAVMAFTFSITTPAGIGIGIAISTVYKHKSPAALITEGVLDSISAGILVYMALVDLIAAEFLSKGMQKNAKLQMAAYFALLGGSSVMSVLALWA